jgi:uncharacterized protein (TIGR03067 family)
MKVLSIAALFTFSLSTLAAPGPKEKDDQAKLQGSWAFTSWVHSGENLSEETRDGAKWAVKGDKYTFEIQGISEEGTIKLDSSKKLATIDLIITAGTDKDKTQLGIYKIDGDTITFCLARPGVKERPTDFTSTEENENILVTIKHSKKDD